jgi:Icc-related predicted phosphoesterase
MNRNILAQFGNMDRPEVNDYLEERGINLHGQARLVADSVCLAGIGGSNPTPFRTPSEFAEPELRRLAEQAMEQGRQYQRFTEAEGRSIPLILVSHTPPLNTRLDTLRNGRHVGSSAVRAIIEKYRPDLCISGHIHEAKGRDMLAGTPLCNPGALSGGGWVGVTINSSQLDIHLQ